MNFFENSVSKIIDVGAEIIRVAPAAATGRHRETPKARLTESSSASFQSLRFPRSLKVWVPQILPLLESSLGSGFSWLKRVDERRSVGKMTKNHIVCCVLIDCGVSNEALIKKIEVRVMGVNLFRFFPEIARFPNQSQFDS